MKIKVPAKELKDALTTTKRFVGSRNIGHTGSVRFSAQEGHLCLESFGVSTWVKSVIGAELDGEGVFILPPISIQIMELYLDGDFVEMEVSPKTVKVGHSRLKALSEEVISPDLFSSGVELSCDEWHVLPKQFKEVSRMSLPVALPQTKLNVFYLTPDGMWCLNGFCSSIYCGEDWEFSGYVPVPGDIIFALQTIVKQDDEIEFCYDATHIAFRYRGTTMTSTLNAVFFEESPLPYLTSRDDHFRKAISTGRGVVSDDLKIALQATIRQGEEMMRGIFLSSSEDGKSLRFSTIEGEVGSVRGSVWADLGDFHVHADAKFLSDAIPDNEMWSMMAIVDPTDDRTVLQSNVPRTLVICVETESNVKHYITPRTFTYEILNQVIEKGELNGATNE